MNIIRKHRVWEVFLVEKLGFDKSEIHEEAEKLEHVTSEKLLRKLKNSFSIQRNVLMEARYFAAVMNLMKKIL